MTEKAIARGLWLGIAVYVSAASQTIAGSFGVPPMQVYSSQETGVKTMAWAATQDSSGIMYFGCDNVISFDGDRWRTYQMDATYAVRGLDVGPNGRIWAAGVDQIGWFGPENDGILVYHSLNSFLPVGTPNLGDVWRVYSTGNDSAVFVAQSEVLRWDGHKFETWAFPNSTMLWSTRTTKGIYVHYPPVGLLKMRRDGLTPIYSPTEIGTDQIRWLDDRGEQWILLTANGLSTFDGSRMSLDESDASLFIRKNVPTSAVRLADGTLAIGTLRGA